VVQDQVLARVAGSNSDSHVFVHSPAQTGLLFSWLGVLAADSGAVVRWVDEFIVDVQLCC